MFLYALVEALQKAKVVVRFVEGFRELCSAGTPARSRLISMRVPEPLLEAFKTKAKRLGVAYQTQIKRLMETWLNASPRA